MYIQVQDTSIKQITKYTTTISWLAQDAHTHSNPISQETLLPGYVTRRKKPFMQIQGAIQSDLPLKKKISPRMLATASKLPSQRSGTGVEGLGRKGEETGDRAPLFPALDYSLARKNVSHGCLLCACVDRGARASVCVQAKG